MTNVYFSPQSNSAISNTISNECTVQSTEIVTLIQAETLSDGNALLPSTAKVAMELNGMINSAT